MKIDYKQMPHCDAKVTHSPTDNCKWCNERPDLQYIRQVWGIAFTGHSNKVETFYNHATGKDEQRPLIPCPSERDRSTADIHRWHGNRPQTSTVVDERLEANSGHYHADGTFISWDRPGIPQCQSMHGNQQCQWKFGHTGPHQECMEVWNHD